MKKETLRRGALAGMAGGMVMAMWSMIVFWLAGKGFWSPLNLIAHTVWHGAPLGAAFSGGAVVAGLVIHMMVSMIAGMAFAVGIRRAGGLGASAATLTATGMAFGLVVWAVAQYGIWPVLDQAAANGMTPWVFALGHLMFGAVTALLIGPVRVTRTSTVGQAQASRA